MRARLFIVAVVAAGLLAGATARAATDTGDEQRFAHLADRERTSAGVAPLTPAADLADVARRHAERMAAAGRPYHNPTLSSEVGNWEALAENVGSGGDVDSVHGAFMSSASHRDHILDPAYLETGVGVVWARGVLYVSVVFRRPAASGTQPAPPPASSPPPPPPPAPTASPPAPAPSARPAAPAPPAPPAVPAPPGPAQAAEPAVPTGPLAPRRVTVRARSLPHADAVVPAPVVALSRAAAAAEPAAVAAGTATAAVAAALLAAGTVAAQVVVVRRHGVVPAGVLR